MNTQPIGVLDSGVGGLSIWREIVRLVPHESTIYIGDSKNCPYGSKSEDEIYTLAKRLVQTLLDKNCKLIVLACNTITVSCLDRLRRDFKAVPIIGVVPVVKTAAEQSRNGRIGILSTSKTAQSQYQRDLINRFAQISTVTNLGTDRLVPFIEAGKTEGIEEVLTEVLEPFKKENIDVLALGCSHFPFLKAEMKKILGKNVEILDSGLAIARQVKRVLESRDELCDKFKPNYIFFTTGDKSLFSKVLRSVGNNNRVEQIEI